MQCVQLSKSYIKYTIIKILKTKLINTQDGKYLLVTRCDMRLAHK